LENTDRALEPNISNRKQKALKSAKKPLIDTCAAHAKSLLIISFCQLIVSLKQLLVNKVGIKKGKTNQHTTV